MSIEKIVEFDPTNKDHLKKIKQYAKKNNISIPLDSIFSSSQDNEYGVYLFTENNNQIKDLCYLQCTKDIKMCYISQKNNNTKSKKILVDATEYALNILGMESVFIKIDVSDESSKNYLEKLNYENLGEEQDKVIFLKERENILDKKIVI